MRVVATLYLLTISVDETADKIRHMPYYTKLTITTPYRYIYIYIAQ